MTSNSVFSKKQILVLLLLSLSILIIFTIYQYNSQVNKNNNISTNIVNNEIQKSLDKKIFEIEGTITSLSSFYHSSNNFTSSSFSNISSNLIKYYPLIEKISYAQLLKKEDLKEFYEDMNNMGMLNYNIYPSSKLNTLLPIVYIYPNSFRYSKYLAYDLYSNFELKNILEDTSLKSNIKYYSKEITNEKLNIINIIKASYFGTITPNTRVEMIKQTSGYFIISINLDTLLNKLHQEFPEYYFSLKQNIHIKSQDKILNIFQSRINLANQNDITIYIQNITHLHDINISSILLNDFILIIIILMLITILYKYNENKIEKRNHLKQLEKTEKLASMGEMIGNIAHQWRQPLSVITTLSTSMQMNAEANILSNEKLINSCDIINKNAQYLSRTIDDFKNFIKGDRIKSRFSLESNINSFLHLLEGTIKNNNINIILNIENNLVIDGYENELTQCFINIFNNAKDALIENNIKEKYIFISAYKSNNKIIIEIKDNAKGIPSKIISKIFEPYFTTKHKSKGTGLGLHMVYSLIVDGMKGSIEAKNIKYDYNNSNYKGAIFTIII